MEKYKKNLATSVLLEGYREYLNKLKDQQQKIHSQPIAKSKKRLKTD